MFIPKAAIIFLKSSGQAINKIEKDLKQLNLLRLLRLSRIPMETMVIKLSILALFPY